MSKYEPLEAFLSRQTNDSIEMTFEQIEKVLDSKLPKSARAYRPWWANSSAGHVNAQAWLSAGFEALEVDMEREKLVFRRMRRKPPTPTPSAAPSAPAASAEARPKGRFPLLGCLKGSVRVMPGVDLTDPVDVTWNAQEGRL